MTKKYDHHLETLNEIRTLMERSSRFISLSGLSGVAAGFWALVGAAAAYAYLGVSPLDSKQVYYQQAMQAVPLGKMSQPEEVAAYVAFLMSGRQTSITGQTLDVNNGAMMP